MKKLIFVLALILFGAGLYAQSSAYTKEIYKDYGTFKLETDDGWRIDELLKGELRTTWDSIDDSEIVTVQFPVKKEVTFLMII